MHQIIGGLILGAVAGQGARRFGLRPFFQGVVREGIRLSRNAEALGRKVSLEAKQLVEEAREDLDGPKPSARRKPNARKSSV